MNSFAPLRYAPFRFLAAGRFVAMFGNSMAPIALAFAVLDLTGSASDLGLVVASRSVTLALFLLFGGVVADRFPRQVVMFVSCALAAASQAAVAALVLTGAATIPLLMTLEAVNGLVTAFAFPAASALIAQTVPDEIRRQANAINRLGINAAMIVGASLGGLLVAGVGPGWGLAANAMTFAIAAVLYALVRVGSVHDATARGESTVRALREGWTEFASRTWLWVVVLGFCFFNAAEIGALNVLGPTVADETIGRPAWGFVLAAQTAGMVVGGVIAMRIRVRRLLLLGVVGCAAGVPLLVALAIVPQVAVLLVAAFVFGVGLEQFGIAWETSMQEHLPPDKLARVYSYDALGSFIAIPIGQVAAGPVAAALGVEWAVLGAAAVVTLSVVGMLASRQVRTLEHRPAAKPPVSVQPEQVSVPE